MEENSRGFSSLTEVPGSGATSCQMSDLYARYRFASGFCAGKDVLEAACGAGVGLGYLARSARRTVGGDIDESNLETARATYAGRDGVEVMRLDAQAMPFGDGSFDVIICYEALYYFPKPERFFREAKRVLRPGGVLVLCTVNREWEGFSPSPLSHGYFSAAELNDALSAGGFRVEVLVGSPAAVRGLRGAVTAFIRRTAISLHLIPKTLKGREALKRFFYGGLKPLPPEVTDGMAEYTPPVPVPPGVRVGDYKVVFAVAYR